MVDIMRRTEKDIREKKKKKTVRTTVQTHIIFVGGEE